MPKTWLYITISLIMKIFYNRLKNNDYDINKWLFKC